MKSVKMTGTIKKWGNSYGIVLPKKVLDAAGFKVSDKVEYKLLKKLNPLREAFGMLPDKGIDLDKALREIDEEFRSKYE